MTHTQVQRYSPGTTLALMKPDQLNLSSSHHCASPVYIFVSLGLTLSSTIWAFLSTICLFSSSLSLGHLPLKFPLLLFSSLDYSRSRSPKLISWLYLTPTVSVSSSQMQTWTSEIRLEKKFGLDHLSQHMLASPNCQKKSSSNIDVVPRCWDWIIYVLPYLPPSTATYKLLRHQGCLINSEFRGQGLEYTEPDLNPPLKDSLFTGHTVWDLMRHAPRQALSLNARS